MRQVTLQQSCGNFVQVTTFVPDLNDRYAQRLQSYPQRWKHADEETAMSDLPGPRFRLSEGAAMTDSAAPAV